MPRKEGVECFFILADRDNEAYFLPNILNPTDDAGTPLQFVSIIEKGTPNGTSADSKGNYKKNPPHQAGSKHL